MQRAIRFTFIALAIFAVILSLFLWPFYGLIAILSLLLIIGLIDVFQKEHTVLRNFPILGHMRYLLEMISPEIHQYFIESDTDGKPLDRNHREYVYKRAKKAIESQPYGTRLDTYDSKYQWMRHSIYPSKELSEPPRIRIGGKECKKPYEASLLNISAMSYGALGKNAIKALNIGAREGDFYHNTGEGGISDYHLLGGDIVYQIGTGYFGCRDENGDFSPEEFKERASLDAVKMIEIKLSQGAKAGKGGLLPAKKNTSEIAKIRGVKPHVTIISPSAHSKFSDAEGLLDFIAELRELSGGKPIGFKLCIGDKDEFIEICEKMNEKKILPDFITLDGAEGGTGAAPIDFANYVGMPWESGLTFLVDTLREHDLKKDIKVITATKIITAFDLFRALCIGADLCNSARGMMLAIGCIQALKCNTNSCPTGVATSNSFLMNGLVVSEKSMRVTSYHRQMLRDFLALFAATGCDSLDELNRDFIYQRGPTEDWVTSHMS